MEHQTIQNFDELATNTLRKDALSLVEIGYEAINTGAALAREIHIQGDELCIGTTTCRLVGRRIFFVGIGKCAIAGAVAIEKILGDRLTDGIALDVANHSEQNLSKIQVFIGTHPSPSEANERATKRIIEMLTGCEEDDLVLFLISGGGSTLICLPTAPMTCLDENVLFTELTEQGATIQELNTVRKHTSSARGGGLAKAAYPAEVISLIISDVPGNDIATIASGPTVRDTSTIDNAHKILAQYNMKPSLNYAFIETPKDEKYFERVSNILFLTNQQALLAMQDEASKRGYSAIIMNDTVTGEAQVVGRSILEELHTMPSKTVLLYAGETTVTLAPLETRAQGALAGSSPASLTGRGDQHGAGGRNQEMTLGVLEDIHDNELILPFASDGHDNTDHAGAIADVTTRAHANEKNLSIDEYLARHCSYDFFAATGDALDTGYTESNVSDIIIAIKN